MTIIMFAGLMVPFILLTDIFPFMRFGMFAEPIKKETQTETFIVYKTDTTGRKSMLRPEEIGINPNTFYYLCRNYLYRNEAKAFAEKIFSATNTSITEITFLRIVRKAGVQHSDTLQAGNFSRNE